MHFNINDWSFRVGLLGFFMAGCACSVPQWIIAVPNSQSFGAREGCTGNTCSIINFESLKHSLNCDGGCSDAFDQFRLRWRAVEAFGWMATMLYIITLSVAAIGLRYEVRPKPLGAAHLISSLAALFASGLCVVTLWGSIRCGSACFEVGASAVCAAVAALLCLSSIPIGLCAVRMKQRAKRRMWLSLTVFVSLAAAAMQMFAMLSNKFFFTRKVAAVGLEVISLGIFHKCRSALPSLSCETMSVEHDIISLAKTAGCAAAVDLSAADIAIKMWAGAACFGLAALLSPLLAYFSYRSPVEDDKEDGDEAAKEEKEKLVEDGAPNQELSSSSAAAMKQENVGVVAGQERSITATPGANPLLAQPAAAAEAAAEQEKTLQPGVVQKPSVNDDAASLPEQFEQEEYPNTRCFLIVLLLLLVTVGNALVLYHLDGGMLCGQSYCTVLSRLTPTTSCHLGVSAVCSIILNALLALLLAMEVFHRAVSSCAADAAGTTRKEWVQFTSKERELNPDLVWGMWGRRWMELALLLAAVCVLLFGTLDARWSVTANVARRFGPWEHCGGHGNSVVCSSYSSEGCGGGAVGSERTRFALVGVAAALGVAFGLLSLLFVFSRRTFLMVAVRFCLLCCLESCCVTAVIMWSSNALPCEGATAGAFCQVDGNSCSFGISFWCVVGAMCAAGIVLVIALVELILMCVGPQGMCARSAAIAAERRREDEEKIARQQIEDAEYAARLAIAQVVAAHAEGRARGEMDADYLLRHLHLHHHHHHHHHDSAGEAAPIADTANPEAAAAAETQNEEPFFDEDSDPALVGLDFTWRYDAGSGYWWSDERHLFYNHRDREYGCPESRLWTLNGQWPATENQEDAE